MKPITALAEGDFDGALEIAAEMSAAGNFTRDYASMLARLSGDQDRFLAELTTRGLAIQPLKPPPGFDDKP